MNVLVYLMPLALGLGALGLAGFLWAMRSGQFEDLDGAAWRAITDQDEHPSSGELPADAGAGERERERRPLPLAPDQS